jgi:hypothetical protein
MMLVAWSLFLRRASSFGNDDLGTEVLAYLPGIHGISGHFLGKLEPILAGANDSDSALIGNVAVLRNNFGCEKRRDPGSGIHRKSRSPGVVFVR